MAFWPPICIFAMPQSQPRPLLTYGALLKSRAALLLPCRVYWVSTNCKWLFYIRSTGENANTGESWIIQWKRPPRFYHFCRFYHPWPTLLRLQSRFEHTSVTFLTSCQQNGTAILKGLRTTFPKHRCLRCLDVFIPRGTIWLHPFLVPQCTNRPIWL